MNRPLGVACAIALAAAAGTANAATVEYMANIPLQITNWNNPLNLPQWDPALFPDQTLTKVTIMLTGSVDGDARVESLDAAASTINFNVSSTITLTGPSGVNILVLPLVGGSFNATAFDGISDFLGTSGQSNLGLTNSDMGMQMLTSPPTDFLAGGFIGNGNVAFNLTALGTSSASGPGNVISQFRTEAGAVVKVTYEFIPAPSAMALLGLGGLIATRRRR